MRIFLSYASPDRELVEPIRLALAAQRHEVFFDREDLPPGEEFDSRIRAAIERCHLFIFFLSPNAVDAGSYTLSELAIAERIWSHPSGRLLPVVLHSVPFEQIPAYLKSVTLFEPVGNSAASVADTVHKISADRRRKLLRKIAVWAIAVLIPVGAAALYLANRGTHMGKDSAPSVLISAGNFIMGDDEFSPRRELYVDAFYLDTFEVTTARYGKFLEANGSLAPPEYWDTVSIERDGTLPVVGVDWHDADAYCRWAGKRLPTEAEWEKAARGSDERPYPWGSDEPSPAHAAYSRTAENPYQGGVTPVGSHPAGASAAGVHDLAGNVSEWVADWYSESFSSSDVRNPVGPPSGPGRVMRGSGWHEPAERLIAARRYYAGPDQRSDDLGFRCAQDGR